MNKKILIFIVCIISAILLSLLSVNILFNTNKGPKNDFKLEEIESSTNTSDVVLDVENTEKEDLTIEDTVDDSLNGTEVEEGEDFPLLSDIGNVIKDEDIIIYDEISSYEELDEDLLSIPKEDIEFLANLISISDSYSLVYSEAISYLMSSDTESLVEFINTDFSDVIEGMNLLETENEDLKSIKENYYNGMLKAKEGFLLHGEEMGSQEGNQSFIDSDSYFYNGRYQLEEFLNNVD